MIRDRLICVGMRVVAMILVGISLTVGLTYGNEKLKDNQLVPVEYDSFDRLWGTRPSEFEGIRHIADIAPKLSVFSADFDLSAILGTVGDYFTPRLVFAQESGLVKVHINFDPKDYDVVHNHLTRLLGEPIPIIYELWAAQIDFIWRSEWHVGMNTKVVLTSRMLDANIEISRRDVFVPEDRSFENTLATAQLKQAQEYERQNKILEASSVYQELVNSTYSHRFFTPTAQERLAAYSQQSEATEYLGQEGGFTFSRLINLFNIASRQQWVRIDFDLKAREELQKQRPSDIEPQDGLSDISAVLCLVKASPADGKYLVVEQVWLDSSGRIIGGRPAWAPQDAAWPAPYIKQACEDFLKAWFTVDSITVKVTKE